jgi:hypothetical protein
MQLLIEVGKHLPRFLGEGVPDYSGTRVNVPRIHCRQVAFPLKGMHMSNNEERSLTATAGSNGQAGILVSNEGKYLVLSAKFCIFWIWTGRNYLFLVCSFGARSAHSTRIPTIC